MRVLFSESFDRDVSFGVRSLEPVVAGELRVGPLGLLADLELRLGLTCLPAAHGVRVEKYRQALLSYADQNPSCFFNASLKRDSQNVAKDLLSKRDELKMGGFNFIVTDNLSPRLKAICELEELVDLPNGKSDRLWQVIDKLRLKNQSFKLPYESVTLFENPELSGPGWCSLLEALRETGVSFLNSEKNISNQASGDLGAFQAFLKDPKREKLTFKGDGSLKLLKFPNEIAQAEYMAAFLEKNPNEDLVILCEEEVELLNDALKKRGLPIFGSRKLSMARPSLQLIPLIQCFLWEPLDCSKVIEFLSHEIKPINGKLAYRLASEMCDRPGMGSLEWSQALDKVFGELDEKTCKKAKEQYGFFFERKRYRLNEKIPVTEVIELFTYLKVYCDKRAQAVIDGHSFALVQTGAVLKDLIEILELVKMKESAIDKLFLDGLIKENLREIVDESLRATVGALELASSPMTIKKQVDNLCWFTFAFPHTLSSQSFWGKNERNVLKDLGVSLKDSLTEGLRLIEQATEVIHQVKKELLIFLPETIKGEMCEPHPLFSDLLAATENIDKLIHEPYIEKLELFKKGIIADLPSVPKTLEITEQKYLVERQKESYSSMVTLLHYPTEWFLHYHARLTSSGHFSVSDGPLLFGNICHKAIENFFNDYQDVSKIKETIIDAWVEENYEALLKERGAILLLPGREDDRLSVRVSTQNALKNLVNIIKTNGYELHGVEKPFEGQFSNVPFGGSIDLILKKGEEFAIIDIKYSGKGSKSDLLKDDEDYQLCLYSLLFEDQNKIYPTAYYLLKNEELISKNNSAFKKATVPEEKDYETAYREAFRKLVSTYQFRVKELKAGKLEVVTNYSGEKTDELQSEDFIRLETEPSRYSAYGELLDWPFKGEK